MKKLLPLELLDSRQDAEKRRRGLLTYSGWLRRGLVVKRGSKARDFNSSGKALFSEDQATDPDTLVGEDFDGDDDWGLTPGDFF